MTRNEKVKRIVDLIVRGYAKITVGGIPVLHGTLSFQVEQKRPNTFIRVRGQYVTGRGFSKCSAPDIWSVKEGIRIAAKRAAREYIDNVDKWENLTNGE